MRCTNHWQFSVSRTTILEAMVQLSRIIVTIALPALMCVLAEKEFYPNQYDNLDFSVILENKTLRTEYYNCFMEIAPCKTPEQVTLTGIFSEAYQTHCKKCTKKQKEMVRLVSDWFVKNKPDKWQLVVAKIVEDIKKKNAGQ